MVFLNIILTGLLIRFYMNTSNKLNVIFCLNILVFYLRYLNSIVCRALVRDWVTAACFLSV